VVPAFSGFQSNREPEYHAVAICYNPAMTSREWEDLLYDLGLFGRNWLYVNCVREVYVDWKLGGVVGRGFDGEDWGPITEEKLQELLSSPQANLSERDRRVIVDVLHHLVSPEEFPMPRLPKVQ
jgi:hypothetical protein